MTAEIDKKKGETNGVANIDEEQFVDKLWVWDWAKCLGNVKEDMNKCTICIIMASEIQMFKLVRGKL